MKRYVLAAGLFVPVLAFAQFGNVDTDYVPVGDVAYGLVMPVQAIASGSVTRAAWASSGAYALALRMDPKLTPRLIEAAATGRRVTPLPTTGSLILYNAKTQKATEVFNRSGPGAEFTDMAWLVGADVAYAALRESLMDRSGKPAGYRTSLVEVDAVSGRVRVAVFMDTEQAVPLSVAASPTAPQVALGLTVDTPEIHHSEAIVVSPGTAPKRVVLPEHHSFAGWTQDGNELVVTQVSSMGLTVRSRLDIATGTVRDDEVSPEVPQLVKPRTLKIDRHASGLANIGGQPSSVLGGTGPVYLCSAAYSSAPKVLVALEAEFAELSPKEDAVLYITRGVALVRPITSLPREAYESARDAALRAKALAQAKRVGAAIIINGAMNPDVPLGIGPGREDKVAPHLDDREPLNGFVFAFSGKWRDLKDDDNTELGYVRCPGGRAVVYADGHTEFVPDKEQ